MILVARCRAVEITTRASSSFADALVLYATWRVTGSIRKLARRFDVNVSFASLVLADGTPAHPRRSAPRTALTKRLLLGTLYFWCARCPPSECSAQLHAMQRHFHRKRDRSRVIHTQCACTASHLSLALPVAHRNGTAAQREHAL